MNATGLIIPTVEPAWWLSTARACPRGLTSWLAELARVLQPGGRLIVVDWGKPTGPMTRIGFRLLRALDGFQNTAEHAAGRVPTLIADAGFNPVSRTSSLPPSRRAEVMQNDAHDRDCDRGVGEGYSVGRPALELGVKTRGGELLPRALEDCAVDVDPDELPSGRSLGQLQQL